MRIQNESFTLNISFFVVESNVNYQIVAVKVWKCKGNGDGPITNAEQCVYMPVLYIANKHGNC